MKSNEKVSFFRAILIFFIIIEIITLVIYYIENNKEIKIFQNNTLKNFKINSFDFNDEKLKIARILKSESIMIETLIIDKYEVSAYFPEKNKDTLIKISMSKEDYIQQQKAVLYDLSFFYTMVTLVNLVIAIILAKYIITPLKESLNITDEFIKDILHDINTPISVIKMNIAMLEEEIGENKKIDRIKTSIEKILFLQNNLRGYQQDIHIIKEKIKIKPYLEEKIKYFNGLYPDISIYITEKVRNKELKTSKDYFDRIIENVISNACKYNKKGGKVEIIIEESKLLIIDTGIGIKNPNKVFERLYKETDRGLGLGLNIVKKLINELGMDVRIGSRENEGTEFIIIFDKK